MNHKTTYDSSQDLNICIKVIPRSRLDVNYVWENTNVKTHKTIWA